MTMIRPAIAADANALVLILNDIIAAGSTTAHQTPFTPERLLRHYLAPSAGISCAVASNLDAPVGFQTIVWPDDPADPLHDGWAVIATFVKPGLTGTGIGTALFQATKTTAQAAGVSVIDATIRADNAGGLRYYSKMGFTDYALLPAVPLGNGQLVDRIRKKFTFP